MLSQGGFMKNKKKLKKWLVKYYKIRAKVAKKVPIEYWNKHF